MACQLPRPEPCSSCWYRPFHTHQHTHTQAWTHRRTHHTRLRGLAFEPFGLSSSWPWAPLLCCSPLTWTHSAAKRSLLQLVQTYGLTGSQVPRSSWPGTPGPSSSQPSDPWSFHFYRHSSIGSLAAYPAFWVMEFGVSDCTCWRSDPCTLCTFTSLSSCWQQRCVGPYGLAPGDVHTHAQRIGSPSPRKIARNGVELEARADCTDQVQGVASQVYWPAACLQDAFYLPNFLFSHTPSPTLVPPGSSVLWRSVFKHITRHFLIILQPREKKNPKNCLHIQIKHDKNNLLAFNR